MTREELQERIDRARSPAEMLTIGEAYLRGEILLDKVAADAWLSRAVEAEDPAVSPRAMALIAKEILGKKRFLSPEDERDIRTALPTVNTDEKEALEALLRWNYDE